MSLDLRQIRPVVVNITLWAIPLGTAIQVLRGFLAYRRYRRMKLIDDRWRFRWDPLRGPRCEIRHALSGNERSINGS